MITSPISQQSSQKRRLLPLLLLHLAAAGVCFSFLAFVPLAGCFIVIMIDGDPGGPMFIALLVLGTLFLAFVITALLACAAVLSGFTHRHYRVPIWLPPLVVFTLATGSCWLFLDDVHLFVPPLVGVFIMLAFLMEWAAISTVWFLPRLLFHLFGVQHVQSEG